MAANNCNLTRGGNDARMVELNQTREALREILR